MTWLLIYLGVGLLNVAYAGVQRRLILTISPKRRDGDARAAGIAEVLFYIFLWPIQALWFVVFVCVPNAIEWLYLKLTGET